MSGEHGSRKRNEQEKEEREEGHEHGEQLKHRPQKTLRLSGR